MKIDSTGKGEIRYAVAGNKFLSSVSWGYIVTRISVAKSRKSKVEIKPIQALPKRVPRYCPIENNITMGQP
jgi:hypothetical protein